MFPEWPQSAHNIQASEPNFSRNNERVPLLHADREPPCLRYVWVTFFAIILCVGLATGAYLLLIEAMDRPISEENYSLISRQGWRAKSPTSNIPKLLIPVKRVLLTSTNTSECSTEPQCSREIHKVQSDHLNRLQEPDIAYNFLIAGDGQTYEGRGWNYQAMVSNSGDNSTLLIAFLGHFNNSFPTRKQINQAKSFLEIAERGGKLTTCYSIEEAKQKNSDNTQGLISRVTSYFQQYFQTRHNFC